jgi:hypothetical protein
MEPATIETVSLEMPGQDVMRMIWQVSLREDGSLFIVPVGRRCGRMQIEPGTHNSIAISTDKIIRARRPE